MTAVVYILGFVQGVGFRHFVKSKADELNLTGYAKNLPDGRVEVVLQSSASSDQEAKEDIDKMILLCRKGPFLSEVKEVEVIWEEPKEKFSEFDIKN